MKTTQRLLGTLGLLLLAVFSVAAENPNTARGFEAGKAFQVGEVDSVNLFNGSLVLTLPIGQRFSAGGNLSYGLSLVYNQNLWRYEEDENYTPPNIFTAATRAEPDPIFSAGLGWMVTLGRLWAPLSLPYNDTLDWIYLSPDGSRHTLYPTLHENELDTPNGGDYFYSRDGSYLRLQASARTIEFPDGARHTFAASSHLSRIEDAFGNYLAVNMANQLDWVLQDSVGRTHHIRFGNQFIGPTRQISSIDLAGYNGASATYTFTYQTPTLYRTCKDTWWGNNNPQNVDGLDQLILPVLAQISGPEGIAYQIKDGAGLADYHPGTPPAGAQCGQAGIIESLELPTKGKYSWTHQEWRFPAYSVNLGSINHLNWTVGVASRTLTDPYSSADGTWTYATEMYPDLPNPRRGVITTVTDPEGNKVKHYFAAPQDLTTGPQNQELPREYRGWEYGLPFTWDTSVAGKYLSREVFNAAGTKVRQHWVTYEHDQLLGVVPHIPSVWYDSNRRVISERTTFLDDSGRFIDANHSDFDGFGHHRATNRYSSWDSLDNETTRTQFNGTGCYGFHADTNLPTCTGYTPWATDKKWVLGTATYSQVNQGGIARTFLTYEGQTGFLSCQRIVRTSTNRGPNDVLVVYDRDAQGNVTAESHYGGDTQTLGTASGCAAPSSWAYRIEHTTQHGVRSSSRYRRSTTAVDFMPFYSYRADIDRNTSLPKTSYDTAGFPTAATWDLLGRLKSTETVSSVAVDKRGAKTSYTYTNAGGSGAKVTVTKTCNLGTSCVGGPYGDSELNFDGFGRVTYQFARLPNGLRGKTITSYNALGWKKSVSEQGAEATADSTLPSTQYQSFDAFGRPTRIRPPDYAQNAAHEISLSYTGVRLVSRTVNVATAAGVETAATTSEHYDGQGRLVKVQEPSGAAGALVTTTYEYDLGDRLSHVKQDAGAAGVQHRYFTYDNRGFLLSESHPEKEGLVEYELYDARGHAASKIDSLATRKLAFAYDKAERLKEVKEDNGSPSLNRVLKTWAYDTAASWGLGKLHAAEATNYFTVPAATVKVTETYNYNEIEGRVSDKATRVNTNGADGELFTQTFDYDQAGALVSQTYPSCFFGGCGTTGVPTRTVDQAFTQGYLTSVSGYANSIGYHVNGMLATVAHSNNVTDTISLGMDLMRRPTKIATSGVLGGVQNFDTGTLTYDGAGNIKAMGTHSFLYDKVSRLVSGTVRVPSWAAGSNQTQTYSFDAFGNLTSVGGVNGRNTPTSALTNRLNGLNVEYDEAGNLVNSGGATPASGTVYEFDRLNRLQKMTTASGPAQEIWVYIYTADDERFWSLKLNGAGSLWSLRDLSGNVVRQFEAHLGWSTTKDSIYRGGQLLSTVVPDSTIRHYHLDHLGTPRLITGPNAAMLAHHTYFPFGEEVTGSTGDAERMKFTGHERDLNNAGGVGDDLDYMHARFCSPVTGRFLSPDRAPGKRKQPQSWNRYTYTLANPMRYVDPNGLEPLPANYLQFFNAFFHTDFSWVDLQSGFQARLVSAFAGGMALTLGNTIYLGPAAELSGHTRASPGGMGFLGHELVHVMQQRQTSRRNFIGEYLGMYNQNRKAGQTDEQAYSNIIHEQLAAEVGKVITSFLEANGDIRQKLQNSEPLNAEDLEKISGALEAAEKSGQLKTGFQFIQGILVYVSPSK